MSSIIIACLLCFHQIFLSENINSDVEILLDKLSKSSKNEAKQIRNEIWNVWLNHRNSSIGNLTRQAMDYFSTGELS